MQSFTLLNLASKLIECPSVTPLDAGCQDILYEYLDNRGFQIERLNFEEVNNLWCTHGQGPPYFVFAGHTDVVPAGNLTDWIYEPFKATIKEGVLYGRGAADMKGSLAAMVIAAERFILQYPNHPGTIAFLITGDEEGPAINGTKKVIQHLKHIGISLDYCIIGEPSSHTILGDTIKIGRRGSLSGLLNVIGKQGHIAYPEKAINPIHHAVTALSELIQIEWDSGTDTFPPTSLQISNIASGVGAGNVIPAKLDCHFNFRFSPNRSPDEIKHQVHTVLEKHGFLFQLDWTLFGLPFLTEKGKLLAVTRQAIEKKMGILPHLSTNGGTSDGRFIKEICPELLELGPCNATIHSVNECVKIEDLEILSSLYEEVLDTVMHSHLNPPAVLPHP